MCTYFTLQKRNRSTFVLNVEKREKRIEPQNVFIYLFLIQLCYQVNNKSCFQYENTDITVNVYQLEELYLRYDTMMRENMFLERHDQAYHELR